MTDTTTLVLPSADQEKLHAANLLTAASQIQINNPHDYQMAGEFAKEIRRLIRRITNLFGPTIDAAHKAHRAALAARDSLLTVVKEADRTISHKLSAYAVEQERIRRQEQARLLERARREAEEQRLQQALALEADGNKAAAEAVLVQPVSVVGLLVPLTEPPARGISFRSAWTYEIVDSELIPREYLTPDLGAIGKVVRALKGETRIPGIRVYETKTTQVRT